MSRYDLWEVSCKVVLFSEDKERVLIFRYDDGHYGLPGGHLEYGEELEKAMRREIEEELGVKFMGDLKQVGFDVAEWEDNHKVVLGYAGVFEGELGENFDNSERIIKREWVKWEDVRDGKYDLLDGYMELILKAKERI